MVRVYALNINIRTVEKSSSRQISSNPTPLLDRLRSRNPKNHPSLRALRRCVADQNARNAILRAPGLLTKKEFTLSFVTELQEGSANSKLNGIC